ncbi:MAG TPA: hypothetical protein VGP72_33285 [Planctomycetota bacterium]
MSKLLSCVLLLGVVCVACAEEKTWRDAFAVNEQDLVSSGKSTYFILDPGYQLVFAGEDDGKKTELVVTVTNDTKKIGNVETRVVEERETADGKLVEVSRNYFAMDKTTKDVYYFGEDVDMYKDGKVLNHEGSWVAGTNGAKYGLAVPGEPKVGDRYIMEVAPGVAMDRAEIKSITEGVKVPAGKFQKCLKVKETSALNAKESGQKYYAPGVGLLRDGDLKLVNYGMAK